MPPPHTRRDLRLPYITQVSAGLDGAVVQYHSHGGKVRGRLAEAHTLGVTAMAQTARRVYTAGLAGDARNGWTGKVWGASK